MRERREKGQGWLLFATEYTPLYTVQSCMIYRRYRQDKIPPLSSLDRLIGVIVMSRINSLQTVGEEKKVFH